MAVLNDRQIILIVDDVPANIKILGQSLREDYDVRIATSGTKAIEIAKSEQKPDLILMDIMMPDLDGYAVLNILKQAPESKDIPVIFITAKASTQDEIKGFENGAVDYITKPFQLPIVKARVNTHLRLKRKSDLLESLASIDGLTEIPNRRAFDEMLDNEWKRAVRERHALGLLMLDVDFFKNYNDHYGHGAGDICLKKIAEALTAALLRPGGFCGRYGGEEFAAILPNTDLESLSKVADRIRATVEAMGLPHEYSDASSMVTVSIGGSVTVPAAEQSPRELLNFADKMLYEAKNSGRNRSVCLPLTSVKQV